MKTTTKNYLKSISMNGSRSLMPYPCFHLLAEPSFVFVSVAEVDGRG